MSEIRFEVGREYKTKGGWKAVIAKAIGNNFLVKHLHNSGNFADQVFCSAENGEANIVAGYSGKRDYDLIDYWTEAEKHIMEEIDPQNEELRDKIAIAAMQAIISPTVINTERGTESINPDDAAEVAFKYADAFMRARSKES